MVKSFRASFVCSGFNGDRREKMNSEMEQKNQEKERGRLQSLFFFPKKLPPLLLFLHKYSRSMVEILGLCSLSLLLILCFPLDLVIHGIKLFSLLIESWVCLVFINISPVRLIHKQLFLGFTLIIGLYKKIHHNNSFQINLIFGLYHILQVEVSLLRPICNQSTGTNMRKAIEFWLQGSQSGYKNFKI